MPGRLTNVRCRGKRQNGAPCYGWANATGLCKHHRGQAELISETPDQSALLVGRRYNRAKLPPGGLGGDRRSAEAIHRHQKEGGETGGTRGRIAGESGVSASTVERAGKFAAAVEKLKTVEPRTPGDAVDSSALPPPAGRSSWLDVIVARHRADHSEQEAAAAAEELARLRRVASDARTRP